MSIWGGRCTVESRSSCFWAISDSLWPIASDDRLVTLEERLVVTTSKGLSRKTTKTTIDEVSREGPRGDVPRGGLWTLELAFF